jgi:PhnB protein
MTGLVPYILVPGTTADALPFYQAIFGGELSMHTYAEFDRADGPGDAIAHGMLGGGPVALGAADAGPDEDAVHMNGLYFSLLGTAAPETLTRWFAALSDGGRVIDPLHTRPWGDHDGTLVDRFGVRWLIGYEG